jgi:tRNA G18 (ribose-2'-O)-methylase SpoU
MKLPSVPTVRPDTRNVVDFYRYWSEEAIKADLREKHHDFSVLLTNRHRDFNIGTVIRNANAFCAKEVIIYGSKQYDRRGTVGAHLYTSLKHVRFTDELDLSGATLIGIDNVPGSEPIEEFQWPSGHVVMAFGEEGGGLSEELISRCQNMLYIKQYGSVRSLNVGVASGIAMYDYCRKMTK